MTQRHYRLASTRLAATEQLDETGPAAATRACPTCRPFATEALRTTFLASPYQQEPCQHVQTSLTGARDAMTLQDDNRALVYQRSRRATHSTTLPSPVPERSRPAHADCRCQASPGSSPRLLTSEARAASDRTERRPEPTATDRYQCLPRQPVRLAFAPGDYAALHE